MQVRLLTLRALTLLLLLVLTGRLAQLQLIEGNTFRSRAVQNTIRTDYILPVRGEIYASNGTTRLAATVPIFNVVVRPDTLPEDKAERKHVFSRLSSILALTDTLSISPSTALRERPQLASELRRIVGPLPERVRVWKHLRPLVVTLPHSQTLAGLELSRRYPAVVRYNSFVAQTIRGSDLPPYLSVPIKTEVSRALALAVRENQSILPGVQVVQSYRRGYPLSDQLTSLAHILGFTGKITKEEYDEFNPPPEAEGLPNYLLNDLIGKAGLEFEYEDALRGSIGIREIEVDANQMSVGEPLILQPKVDGHNLVLSIDITLQRHTEAMLNKWIAEANRRRKKLHPEYAPIDTGVITVMDVNTGAILASVSLPGYDNNLLTRPLTQQEVEYLFANEKQPMLNRAIANWYPPGSTFKQVSAAAGLGLDIIQPSTRVRDPGRLIVLNEYDPSITYEFPNAVKGDRGLISVIEALMDSSNVFFEQVIGGTNYVSNLRERDPRIKDGVGADRLAQIAEDWFGLGQPTGIDLPGEVKGFIPNSKWKEEIQGRIWSLGDTYNMAIGQGDVLLTPLQVLNVTATLANGGTRYKPKVVKEISTLEGEAVRRIEPEVIDKLPLEPHDLAAIKLGMYRSLQDRKAYNNRVASPQQRQLYSQLQLAGKTGTAEYREPTGRRRSHSWFVGFAPYEKPEIAVVAFLAGTGDLNDGSGTLALPAVAEVMAAHFGLSDPAKPQDYRRP